jgi:polar amino acid transport system permease protein
VASGPYGPPNLHIPPDRDPVDPRTPPPPRGSSRSRILGGGDAGARNVWIAVASTAIFFGVAMVIIVNSPGWPQIKDTFFNPVVFRESFPKIVRQFGTNIFIFIVAEVFVLIVALFLAVLRSLPGPVFAPLRFLSIGYTDLFRGIPTILVISLLGFGMPALQLQGLPKSPEFWAIVALILVYSAYVAEVYRAGIESVHPSQAAAARSLGLSRMASMRHVVLPQAVRRVIPPLLNDFIGLQKDSALVAFLGVAEAFQTANIISAANFSYTPLVSLALVYLIITIPQTRFVDWLVERDRRRSQSGTLT